MRQKLQECINKLRHIFLFVCLSVSLSVCPFLCLSVCLSVCLSACVMFRDSSNGTLCSLITGHFILKFVGTFQFFYEATKNVISIQIVLTCSHLEGNSLNICQTEKRFLRMLYRKTEGMYVDVSTFSLAVGAIQ